MAFFGLAKSRKTLTGAIANAGAYSLAATALTHFAPAEATGTAGAALFVMWPAVSSFVLGFCNQIGSLWANQRTAEYADEERENERQLNHDLERQVGRTLATLVEQWSRSASPEFAGAISRVPEILRALDPDVPKWAQVADSIQLEVESDQLVESALGREAGSLIASVPAEKWSELVRKLARLARCDPKLVAWDTLWRSIGRHIEQGFPAQFNSDIKRALDQHPKRGRRWNSGSTR